MSTRALAGEDRRALRRVAFGLGAFLPLLAGGNHFLGLTPETGVRLFAVVTAAAAAFLVLRFPPTGRSSPLALGFLALLLAVWGATLLLRPTGPRAFTEATGVFCAAILYAVLEWRFPRGPEAVRGFAGGLVAGTLLTTVYGQYQYWIELPAIAPQMRATFGVDPFYFVNANFYSPNTYAPFLAAVIVLASGFAAGGRGAHRIAALAVLPLLLGTLWLTASRATFSLLAAGLLALAGAPQLRRATPRHVALAGLVTVALSLGIAVAASYDLADLFEVGALGRVDIWHGALRMIGDHWLFGVGLGQFGEAFYRYQVTDYYTRYPHNVLLEAFAEMGIAGGLALTGFLAASFVKAVRAIEPPRGGKPAANAFLFAAAALLAIHALVDIDWHAPANPILLFVLLSLVPVQAGDVRGDARC